MRYFINGATKGHFGFRLFPQHFKKPVLSAEAGNQRLAQLIAEGKPFAAARFGGTEARTIADVLYTQAGGKFGGLRNRTIADIMKLSGFFPADKAALNRFTQLYLDCCSDIDVLAVWDVMLQEYLANDCTVQAEFTRLAAMDSYLYEAPWTSALEGKRVVVIQPFAETIQSQYARHDALFENPQTLPSFQLRTVKAVQTLAGEKDTRFASWFDALDYMYDEAMREDFDIALIGCGAYGFPLAARIKRAGKQAVHMGGCLQVLFGIKGARWDNNERTNKFYNDAWVRPAAQEVIKRADEVEGACYW